MFPNVEELDAVLNIQYRNFEGIPIFRCSKEKMDFISKQSSYSHKERKAIGFRFEDEIEPFKVYCNFEDPYDLKAHQLCQFFEKTQIGFKLIQSIDKITVHLHD